MAKTTSKKTAAKKAKTTKSTKAHTASKPKAQKAKVSSKKPFSIYHYVPAWAVSAAAAVLSYVAFSLAIDSGSLIHYGLGFYFIYAAAHHGKVAWKSRNSNDKRSKTSRAAKAR